MRISIVISVLSSFLFLGGCASLPAGQNNVYETQQQAQLAYNGGDDVGAENLLLGLVRAVPNDAETWLTLGNLYARSNRPDQAAEAYQKVLMLNRGDPRAWHNMGIVRLRQAWAAFILAYDLFPAGSEAHAKVDELIKAMEKMPLEGLRRARQSAPESEGKK
jgi:tetratricopeptide (TPR) repeat protein